jgi:hypothetical protein
VSDDGVPKTIKSSVIVLEPICSVATGLSSIVELFALLSHPEIKTKQIMMKAKNGLYLTASSLPFLVILWN